MAFYKNSLGDLYDKCSNDDKFKNNLKFKFDLKRGFGNYEGAAALSHYHEAAYDAYMTGLAMGHILKLKEIDFVKNGGESKQGGKHDKKDNRSGKNQNLTKEMKDQIQRLKNNRCDLGGYFPAMWLNKMMLDQFGAGRVYHFEPANHAKYMADLQERPEFLETVYLTFKPGFADNLSAEAISELFNEYGDFYAYKDKDNSCFFEFFYVDPTHLPDRKLDTFIEKVVELEHVESACIHQKAPRFKAHDRFDYK